ncbi:hypothetical protein G7068_06365 [Leucobacter viscericola]|uniref:Uncharacterized protein n=1 Tax=Leucobacter viscericola TaxID=2714935 RepID=A0A6G7XEC8_9MICO|nr:hypothetical protein [Leucobacter viscericola]QIK62862.1 hypothetical protein G7068_06365 [Leucobacter viscericola]
MSEMQHPGNGTVALSTEHLVPGIQQVGSRDIEVTFLGKNAGGQPTWLLWDASQPHLIALLSQGRMGYHLEQRTSYGVMIQENISLSRVQRALGG